MSASPDAAPDDPGPPLAAQLLRYLRVAVLLYVALPVYGCAWLVAAGVALVCFGARAGWRDMRNLAEGE